MIVCRLRISSVRCNQSAQRSAAQRAAQQRSAAHAYLVTLRRHATTRDTHDSRPYTHARSPDTRPHSSLARTHAIGTRSSYHTWFRILIAPSSIAMDADALAAAMQQIQAAMQQMQVDHAAQMQHAGAAIAQLQAAQVHAPPAARAPTLRIAPPPHYNGTSPQLDEWTAALRQQFAFYGWATDAEQIRFAAAHLMGPALDWYEHECSINPPATWAIVDAGLRARFQPITTADAARAKLFSLEQGKNQSVNDYVASFRRLAVALKSTDSETLMFQFRRGLSHHLRVHLVQQQPATIDAAIALAVRMGAAHGAAAASSSSGMEINALGAGDGEAGESAAASSDAPIGRVELFAILAAMQAGRNNGSGINGRGAQGASGGFHGPKPLPKISGFSEEKVRKYMDAGMCFGCDAKDHTSRVCPRRIVDAHGRVSWSK